MKYLYNKYLNICIIITSKWYLTEGHLKGEYLERNQFVEEEVLEEEVQEEEVQEEKELEEVDKLYNEMYRKDV